MQQQQRRFPRDGKTRSVLKGLASLSGRHGHFGHRARRLSNTSVGMFFLIFFESKNQIFRFGSLSKADQILVLFGNTGRMGCLLLFSLEDMVLACKISALVLIILASGYPCDKKVMANLRGIDFSPKIVWLYGF